MNGKFDLVSLTQGIGDVDLQHGVCLKVHVDGTWLQEDREGVSNSAVSSTDTQRKPAVSYSVLFTYIIIFINLTGTFRITHIRKITLISNRFLKKNLKALQGLYWSSALFSTLAENAEH